MYTTDTKQKVFQPFAVAGMKALNIGFTNLNCDPLSAPLKDCAQQAQLVVIGGIDNSKKDILPTQLDRIKEIVAAKIPILYLNSHASGGAANDYASGSYDEDFPRLKAMGFANGALPDKSNFYISDFVSKDLSLDVMNKRADFLNSDFLNRIKSGNFREDYDWYECVSDDDCILPTDFINDIVKPLRKLKTQLDSLNTKGQNLFDPNIQNKTLQLLVLWADAYRQTITYPLNKNKDPMKFQMAYIADSLVAYVRDKGAAQTNMGNFLDASVKDVPVSESFETIEVTLIGKSGFTSIGRFAAPGKAFQILLLPPPDGNFKFKLNSMNTGTTKNYESPVSQVNGKDTDMPDSGYRRPEYLMSPEFPLTNQALNIVSPYGGTLQLVFSGTTAKKVTLQIKGTAKTPFYDTTQGQASASSFYRDMTSNKLGWLEIKTPGMEIHSITVRATSALLPPASETAATRLKYPDFSKPYYSLADGILMSKYLSEAKKYVIEDAYRLAGLTTGGLDLNQRVKNFCEINQWNCIDEKIHQPKEIQHFHVDIRSELGSMSSGNPIHSSAGFNPRGWGESHEVGHNLQEFNVYGGISLEVSNNIFPLHKKWRMRMSLTRKEIGYSNELSDTQMVFDLLKNTYISSLSPQEKINKVKDELWSKPQYAAQNRLRLYFYLQWPLIYAEIIKNQNPDMNEADAIEAGWDIFTLMYLNLREVEAVSDADWPSVKARLGFSTYNSKPSTAITSSLAINLHHDYLLALLSMITGRDQTPIFDFWGIQTTQAGRNQVAAYRDRNGQALSSQAVTFYATRCYDDLRGYKSLDMTTPAGRSFPWPDEFKNSDTDPQAGAKQDKHNKYCLSATQ